DVDAGSRRLPARTRSVVPRPDPTVVYPVPPWAYPVPVRSGEDSVHRGRSRGGSVRLPGTGKAGERAPLGRPLPGRGAPGSPGGFPPRLFAPVTPELATGQGTLVHLVRPVGQTQGA